MSSPLPRPMNRCRPTRAYPTDSKRGKAGTQRQQAEGPSARVQDPPPTHLNRPCGGQATARDPTRQATRTQALYTRQSKIAPDEGKPCARGGTRTTYPPLKAMRTRDNRRNPEQSGRSTAQSVTEGVDIVHTRFRGVKNYRGSRCPEIWAAESNKSTVPAATPTTRSKPSSVVKSCR